MRRPFSSLLRAALALLAGLLGSTPVSLPSATPPKLTLFPAPHGAPVSPPAVSAAAGVADVLVVEASSDLTDWKELWRAHGGIEKVADFTAPSLEPRFYRAYARNRALTDDWKNVVMGDPGEAFQSEAPPPWQPAPRWIKFAFLLSDPARVYFQDSTKYDFHYDFARVRLPQFKGLSRTEFDAVSLRTNLQQVVLGAVLFPPSANVPEIGIQFVGLDAYPRESIAAWFRQVRALIQTPPGTTVLYLPTFEQAEVARHQVDWLAGQGVPVSSAGRWTVGDECYAHGWAVGRLVFVPGTGIPAAYRAGQLLPDDILLTDGVPAEVPPLAGIVSFSPATPNSHVALLSRSFGIPFVHVAEETRREELRGATNRMVMVRAVDQFGGCELEIAPLANPLPAADLRRIVDLKAPAPLNLPPKVPRGTISLPADGLRPPDMRYVGGKAANFGVLRRRIPADSPAPALALTFDLWDAFLSQPVAGAPSLRIAIASRLAGFVWPPDIAALQTALAEIRDLITDDADFTAAQKAAVLEVLQQAAFDPARKLRFRSSTNVEDGDQFSGAGLYDSYSGCLADDLDGDAAGPSACDPTESKERGVFRALRKVYASLYNDNAFLERLRHRVDESIVGMAVLVHHSTPDAFELANGVATLEINRADARYVSGELVTQVGAVSVTNPDSAAVPEVVSVSQFGVTPSVDPVRGSSLVPLGGHVLTWDSEYLALYRLLNLAAQGYEAEFPARRNFVLDLEFKKVNPGARLLVKQIREVPQPPQLTYTPWLLDTGPGYTVLQGEHGDLISKHRLKSHWQLAVRHTRLTDAELAAPLLQFVEFEGRLGTNHHRFAGNPVELPGHQYRVGASEVIHGWSQGQGAELRKYELALQRIRETTHRDGPLLTLADHRLELRVTHASRQPALVYDPDLGRVRGTTVTQESVLLGFVPPVSAQSHRQERGIRLGKTLEIQTSFWWPPEPKGIVAGYTAPLQAWIETRIFGLTSRPLVLTSPWSQTYQPGHHNFYEEFAFEPRLDPAVPADLLAELAARNIRAITVGAGRDDFAPPSGFIWGLDDTFRPL